MNRRHFLSMLAAAPPPAAKRPNIIFVLIDDMGYGDLSCYGNTLAQTPPLDQLAAEGVRFRQFSVASPVYERSGPPRSAWASCQISSMSAPAGAGFARAADWPAQTCIRWESPTAAPAAFIGAVSPRCTG